MLLSLRFYRIHVFIQMLLYLKLITFTVLQIKKKHILSLANLHDIQIYRTMEKILKILQMVRAYHRDWVP